MYMLGLTFDIMRRLLIYRLHILITKSHKLSSQETKSTSFITFTAIRLSFSSLRVDSREESKKILFLSPTTTRNHIYKGFALPIPTRTAIPRDSSLLYTMYQEFE